LIFIIITCVLANLTIHCYCQNITLILSCGGGEPELPRGPAQQDVRGVARQTAGTAAPGREGPGRHPGRAVRRQLQPYHGPRPGRVHAKLSFHD